MWFIEGVVWCIEVMDLWYNRCRRAIRTVLRRVTGGSAGSATCRTTSSSARWTRSTSATASTSTGSNRCSTTTSTPVPTQRRPRDDTQARSARGRGTRRRAVSPHRSRYLSIYQEATDIYGLIHARYIITPKGLAIMREKYTKGAFGVCPRVLCERQHTLPVGMSE